MNGLTGDLGAYIQPQLSHSVSKLTDILNQQLELIAAVFDLATGIIGDQWSLEIFG